MITDIDYKESFQGYFYAYLYKKTKPDENIKVGIYPLKKIKGGLAMLNESAISDDEFNEYESQLLKILNDIYDPSVKFTQTADIKRCEYCAYKDICKR